VEVYDRARAASPRLGLVTVYRTLEKLEELGLIQRVHQTQGCQAFISRGYGHEHLLLCTHCGAAVRFSGDKLDALIASISKQTGYRVEEHWLQLFGLCKDCRQKRVK
jgi:Fur family ferric uptake transcriptional regulator